MRNSIFKTLVIDLFLLESSPILIFFFVFVAYDFRTAAIALALSTVVALVASRFINKRVPWFALSSGVITVSTAAYTVVSDNPDVLIIKDTAYYVFFAIALGVAAMRGILLFKVFFGHVFAITDDGWRQLQRRWLVAFILIAVSNEYVRAVYSPEQWVVYKAYLLGVMFLFGNYQFTLLRKHRLPTANTWGLYRN